MSERLGLRPPAPVVGSSRRPADPIAIALAAAIVEVMARRAERRARMTVVGSTEERAA